MTDLEKEVFKLHENWCKANKPNQQSQGANEISFAIDCIKKIEQLNLSDFEELVLKMREAQKNYFKTPHSDKVNKKKWLTESRLRESMVDKYFKAKKNPSLF